MYAKTTFVDGAAPAINAATLNKMEEGIFNNDAKIAVISVGENLLGDFTPTGGLEYPAGAAAGDSYYIDGVGGGGYTFTAGDLVGQTAFNMDKIIRTTTAWALVSAGLDYLAPIDSPTFTGIQTLPRAINRFNDADRVFTIGTSTADAVYEYIDPNGSTIGKNSNGPYNINNGVVRLSGKLASQTTSVAVGNVFTSTGVSAVFPVTLSEVSNIQTGVEGTTDNIWAGKARNVAVGGFTGNILGTSITAIGTPTYSAEGRL